MKDIDAPIGNGHRQGSAARPHASDRGRAWIVSLLFLSGLCALTLTVTWATSSRSPSSPSLFGLDGRVARVVETTNGQCRQFAFDNDSATISALTAPCPTGDAEPAHAGTVRRLDAISKSFLGRE
jgi:hypothetical protein